MVKGRKGRAQQLCAVQTESSHINIVDDVSSPKRKDFKFDNTILNHHKNLKPTTSMVLRGNRTTIQQQSTTPITNYFKTYTLTENPPPAITAENFIDLTEETCDSFNNSITNTTTIDFQKCFNFIHTNPAENIFLQEPVLSLNFDKTQNDKSRIVIRNSFLSSTSSSSPPPPPPPAMQSTFLCDKVINTALDLSKPTQVKDIDSTTTTTIFMSTDSSNSSSDSGIGSNTTTDGVTNTNNFNSSKKRKPVTPHRILCPSPIKNSMVVNPSNIFANSQLELKNGKRILKSKRRDANIEPENKQQIVTNNSNLNDVEILDGFDEKKKVLNVSINPTAQQNTNNNKTFVIAGTTDGNKKLTDFFPVRRSVRKTKKEVQYEKERNIEKAIREQRQDGLKIKYFDCKGRGIVTTRKFIKGEFVVEYIGELITVAEAKERENQYAEDDNAGCYMYYFKHKNIQHCIDATAESDKFGRLVNHSRNGNLTTKTVSVNNRPHLVLLAGKDIEEGEEITYDYGDRSKESLQYHPWLAF
uniref:[histone H4]-lysine(20) N-methyltransferase n=1 Tax=Corethrella appendiculata TaxID=1370023 RepID=U5EU97_9DIPT